MGYQILPNITFILAVVGILLLILKHLPDASAEQHQGDLAEPSAHEVLTAKGLPAQAISKMRVAFTVSTKKIWNFILEAKDLRHNATVGYKMKKIFGGRLPGLYKPKFNQPLTTHEVKNEQYYLDMIKLQPKNLSHYDSLAKFYTETENFTDARDIYQYLVNHQPINPEFQARLAYCFFKTGVFDKAADAYQKSLALDSTQPNRYYNLGLSLEASGNPAEAKQALNQALNLEPDNPKFIQALKNLGRKM